MDHWNTSFLLGWSIFRGYVSFREGILFDLPKMDVDLENPCRVVENFLDG